MSAARHVNPDQLQLLMPAHQIIDNYNPELDWSTKLIESKYRSHEGHGVSLHMKIKKQGIKRPVNLHEGENSYHPQGHGKSMGNGHHRVAAAHDIDPNTEIPVMHHEEKWDAYGYGDSGQYDEQGYQRGMSYLRRQPFK